MSGLDCSKLIGNTFILSRQLSYNASDLPERSLRRQLVKRLTIRNNNGQQDITKRLARGRSQRSPGGLNDIDSALFWVGEYDGFTDPVKMIASLPAILGYARARVLLCGQIAMRLDEFKSDLALARLIRQPRLAIDAVAAAEPRTWSEVRTIIAAAKKGRRLTG